MSVVPIKKPQLQAEFDAFWTLYPRRVAKFGARQAFDKLVYADQLSAIQAVPEHLKYWSEMATSIQYIPHAATWLNQRRFEDEFVSQTPKTILCAWPKCRSNGVAGWGTSSCLYCETHIGMYKRGETPPR